jgi:hypothetical protein
VFCEVLFLSLAPASLMFPAFVKNRGFSRCLLVGLPVGYQLMAESNHDSVVHAEAWSWWLSRLWKDKDSYHFDQYILNSNNKTSKNQSLMLWPSLQEGLKQRAADEVLLHSYIQEMQHKTIKDEDTTALSNSISEILYGKGFTVQDRQVYLEKHGCVQTTPQALAVVHRALQTLPTADTTSEELRGIVEIGVGFGQWARQLIDAYKIDIVAFDNMENLPLDPRVHHKQTKGYELYFYQDKVFFGDHHIFQNKQMQEVHRLNGRVLMMIFPDPGSMAVQSLVAYSESSDRNDMLIYVGEGRGGANGNDAFFDELDSVDAEGNSKWVLQETCKLSPFGQKGFERLFVFKRNSSSSSSRS